MSYKAQISGKAGTCDGTKERLSWRILTVQIRVPYGREFVYTAAL